DDLWLVAPRCRIDERARALASHAGDLLETAKVVDDLEGALAGVRLVAGTSARPRRAPSYRVATPREAAPRLGDGTAVLVGPEDHGLANEELTRCQLHLVIPPAGHSPLRLAQPVLVVAYEAGQARPARGEGPEACGPSAVPGRVGRTGEEPA